MKTLYLDCFSGISGDMFLGAMLDLGVEFDPLSMKLMELDLGGFRVCSSHKSQSGISGVKFEVEIEEAGHSHEHGDHDHDHDHAHPHAHPHPHDHLHSHSEAEHHHHEEHSAPVQHSHGPRRNFAEIKKIIEDASYSEWVKQRAIAVFQRIADAEGKIHGLPPAEVHFHEVGAVDSIVDIVGACLALETLGCPRVLAAPVVDGTGWVKCAHGRFPLPAPATLEILGAQGIALTQCEEPSELVTPTGAALLAEFVEEFGPMRGLTATRVGYGIGTRVNKTRPNVLRAVLCDAASAELNASSPGAHDWGIDTVTVLETNLDDINSELLGHFVAKALDAGALDVFYTPIQMKKNRPGILLSVLCQPADADLFSEMVLRETTAFGVRRYNAERRKLNREFIQVRTAMGAVDVKLGCLDGKVVQASPEYESCKAVAEKSGVPLKHVYEDAIRCSPALAKIP